jgi:hypothetical protein
MLLKKATFYLALAGIGATAVMDAWLKGLQRLGVPSLNFAFIGRWVGHLLRGTWAHAAIARAEPIRHERPLGWLVHYATGIAFASLLVAIQGKAWIEEPTLLPALAIGVITVAAPWGLMQPAMGFGFAARKTPTPWRSGVRSLANHTVFGLGLYLAAVVITQSSRWV